MTAGRDRRVCQQRQTLALLAGNIGDYAIRRPETSTETISVFRGFPSEAASLSLRPYQCYIGYKTRLPQTNSRYTRRHTRSVVHNRGRSV